MRDSRMFILIALGLSLVIWSASSSSGATGGARRVFAHYMVCCPRGGHDQTVAEYREEIKLAAGAGIDGFALNVGSWDKEPYYRKIVSRMFEAAESMPQFKLFFSVDGLMTYEAVSMIEQFLPSPNMLLLDKSVVVSSFGGSKEWAEEFQELMEKAKIPMSFVPCMSYPAANPEFRFRDGYRDFAVTDAVLRDIPWLYGTFFFGAGERYKSLQQNAVEVVRDAHSKGKIAMIGVSPFYKGFAGNSRVFESNGFSGMQSLWRVAIDERADWVELVTWNDWGESTYLCPFGKPADQNLWNWHWGPLLDHSAFLLASKYYIDWFKSGSEPAITRDEVFYFYRVHLKYSDGLVDPWSAPLRLGKPKFWEELNDSVFFTSFLSRPARLSVKIGEKLTSFRLKEGISEHSVNMNLGSIDASFQVGEGRLSGKTLEFPIANDAASGNFNYFSGRLTE